MRHALELLRKPKPALRMPGAEDGAEIWELVKSCKPLDENSMYCNLIQCAHFRETCVLAELDGEAAGWVSGYVMPNDPDTLFVWQVAVAGAARGTGLGTQMLDHLIGRDACKGVKRLQTTITSSNEASWALFRKFADSQDTRLDVQTYFTQAQHFQGMHDSEYMVTIDLQARMKKAA